MVARAAASAMRRLASARDAAGKTLKVMSRLYENNMYNVLSGRTILSSEVTYLCAIYSCYLRRLGSGLRLTR